MRAVVQRVKNARVLVGDEETGSINAGLLVLAGVEEGDSDADIDFMANKILGLRVFGDEEGKMNLSVNEAGGSVLMVSQFTLLGDVRRGLRPSFEKASAPERANELFEKLVEKVREGGAAVETGRFREHMEVSLVNDGPVTILLDSRKNF